jgi:hypothetical protein
MIGTRSEALQAERHLGQSSLHSGLPPLPEVATGEGTQAGADGAGAPAYVTRRAGCLEA